MQRSLVGSEMCIRDRVYTEHENPEETMYPVSYTHLTLPTILRV
ncbi:hypothetical protein JMUB7523_26650 [Staphylococcus aureus]